MKNTVFKGAAWTILSRIAAKFIDFVTLLILARLLAPADFGVVAIAATLINIVDVTLEVPIGQALICFREVHKSHLDSAFTISLARSLVLASAVAVLAWPFSILYSDDRLMSLVLFLSVAPALRGLVSPAMALYLRDVDFSKNFIADLVSKVISGSVAVLVALYWKTYWALIVSTVVYSGSLFVISYLLAPYWPKICFLHFREFFGFLGWLSLSRLAKALSWQSDRLILGRVTSSSSLGNFVMASDLAALPAQSLILPAMSPLMAAFAKLNRANDQIDGAYIKSVSIVVFFGLPIFVGLSLCAQPLVQLVLGEKWLSAALLLQILALEAIPYLFVQPFDALAASKNKTKYLLNISLIELFVRFPLILLAASVGGLIAVAISRLLSAILIATYTMIICQTNFSIPIRQQFFRNWRPIASVAIMAGSVLFCKFYFLSINSDILKNLLIVVIVGILSYSISLVVLRDTIAIFLLRTAGSICSRIFLGRFIKR